MAARQTVRRREAVGLGLGIGSEVEVRNGGTEWRRWREKKERFEEGADGVVEIEEDIVEYKSFVEGLL